MFSNVSNTAVWRLIRSSDDPGIITVHGSLAGKAHSAVLYSKPLTNATQM